MPAFSTFLRVHVSETTFVKSLLSEFGGSRRSDSQRSLTLPRLKTWKGGYSETSSSTDVSSQNAAHAYFPGKAQAAVRSDRVPLGVGGGPETRIQSTSWPLESVAGIKPGAAHIVRTVDIDQERHLSAMV